MASHDAKDAKDEKKAEASAAAPEDQAAQAAADRAQASGEFTTAEAPVETLTAPDGATRKVDPTLRSTGAPATVGVRSDEQPVGKTGAGWFRFASGQSVRVSEVESTEVPRVRGNGQTMLRLFLKSGRTLDILDSDPEALRQQLEAVKA